MGHNKAVARGCAGVNEATRAGGETPEIVATHGSAGETTGRSLTVHGSVGSGGAMLTAVGKGATGGELVGNIH